MPDLSMMRASLEQIRHQIWPLMDALYKGAPEEVSERNRRLNELDRVAKRLAIMIRDINSAQHLQDARASGLYNIPRDSRYSVAQSIHQQQNDLAALRKQAEDLASVVKDSSIRTGYFRPRSGA